MHEAQWGNATLQAATLVTNSNSGTVYQGLQYVYTADGNLTTIADHTMAGGAGDQALTYDNLDRLTEAEGPYGTGGATASITYSYDELGNLTANSKVGTYTYPTSGSTSVRPHAVTTAGSNSYSYDANGNMTGGAGRSFTYNLENKPLTITIGGQTTTFVYDGDNGRVEKVVGSTTTRYISKLEIKGVVEIKGVGSLISRDFWATSWPHPGRTVSPSAAHRLPRRTVVLAAH